MTPSGRVRSATTSGVPPARAIRSTTARRSGGGRTRRWPRHSVRYRVCRALADLPSVEIDARHPGLRRGTGRRSRRVPRGRGRGASTAPWPARQSIVPRASRRPARRVARRRRFSASVTPGKGMNSVACRFAERGSSRSCRAGSVWTSPAASTARPDIASTLRWTRRSMPAMPIADNRPPIVVGIRQTSSDTSTKQGLRRARVTSANGEASPPPAGR